MLTDSVLRKASQLSANLAYGDDQQSVARIAQHMRSYWPPTERAELFRLLDAHDERLPPLAAAAARELRGR